MLTGERRVAVVTGASRGLGRAIALALAERGVRVALCARRKESCEPVADQIQGSGGEAWAFACDVSNPTEVEASIAGTLEAFGRLDILVNNAGTIDPIAPLVECDPQEWERTFRVNIFGAFHTTRAVLPHFMESGGGVILNISSGAAERPREGWSAYCSSKAALAMLTACTARESFGKGILAFGFQPGLVDTDMQGKIRESGINEVSRRPREQLQDPRHPARLAALICTNPPAELNGRDISIRDADAVARIEAATGEDG